MVDLCVYAKLIFPPSTGDFNPMPGEESMENFPFLEKNLAARALSGVLKPLFCPLLIHEPDDSTARPCHINFAANILTHYADDLRPFSRHSL